MKFRRRGVKREHSVLAEFSRIFEQLAALPGVSGLIPGRIANNPTRHPGLVLKNETPSGFKLLAKSNTSVQEVFLICQAGARPAVHAALQKWVVSEASHKAAEPKHHSRKSPVGRPHPRADSDARPKTTRSFGALVSNKPLYRRLQALRLTGSRWRRKYGARLRRVRQRK